MSICRPVGGIYCHGYSRELAYRLLDTFHETHNVAHLIIPGPMAVDVWTPLNSKHVQETFGVFLYLFSCVSNLSDRLLGAWRTSRSGLVQFHGCDEFGMG